MPKGQIDFNFHPHYAGVFHSSSSKISQILLDNLNDLQSTIYIYESLNATIAILLGNTHTESVGAILSMWHKIAKGGSFLGPIFSKCTKPPTMDVFVVNAPIQQISPSVLKAIIQNEKIFSIYSMSNSEVWLLCRKLEDIPVDTTMGSDIKYSRYIFSERVSPKKPRTKKQSRYDPIACQVSELMNHTLPALREQLEQLQNRYLSVFGKNIPKEFEFMKDKIDSDIAFLKKLLDPHLSPELISTGIRNIALSSKSNLKVCKELAIQIEDYLKGVDPILNSETYISAGGNTILKATSAFADEILKSFGLSERYRVIPVFGGDIAILKHLFLGVLNNSKDNFPSTVPLFLSEEYRLRLGMLPCIAHPLAHLYQSKKLQALCMEILKGKYGDYLPKLLTKDPDQINLNNLEWLSKIGRLAIQCAEEILVDFLACSVCGPAYLFSLARFSAGYMSEFSGFHEGSDVHLPIRDRIHLCLNFFANIEIEVSFRSKLIDDNKTVDIGELPMRLSKIVSSPYTKEHHKEAIYHVKEELIKGKVLNVSPIWILNALWNGVANESGYVNEFSALQSILERV